MPENELDPRAAAPVAAGGAPEPPTLLVVDDNPAKRYVTSRWLRSAGFRVVEAATGAEALATATSGIDLVVLDVRLPDLSGYEVCRRLRAEPAMASLPVLHLSAHAISSHERASGLDGGADAYLAQPVDEEELVATVRALLRIRRAETELRASEERFRLAARATNDVLWDWDLTTGRMRWNDAAAALFRRPTVDIEPTASWWFEQIHPDDHQRVVAGLRRVIDGAGDLWADEYRVRRGDGSYAVVFDRGYLAHDERGRPSRMIGSMLDVTDRRQAEQTLELLAAAGDHLTGPLDSEATLLRFARFVIGRFADACVVFVADAPTAGPRYDEDGEPAPSERPAMRLLDVAARDAAYEARVHAELGSAAGGTVAPAVRSAAAFAARLARQALAGRASQPDAPGAATDAAGWPRDDGSFVEHRAVPRGRDAAEWRPELRGDGAMLLGAPGEHSGVRDLEPLRTLHTFDLDSGILVPLVGSDRALGALLFGRRAGSPRYDQADLALAVELAGRAAMATDNALHYERAVYASRAKSDFLAVMSHELRTPLNAVLGYVDLLHLGIAGPQSDEGERYLDRIKFATRHLLGLIEQILLFSRMGAGRELVRSERLDAAELAAEAAALVEPLAREQGLHFVLDVGGEEGRTLSLLTDGPKVRQILLNLLANAVKFTSDGGVRLEVRGDDDAVHFTVTDTGIGIAQHNLDRVFDPFWQVEQRKTRTAGGSGLGLTVSRRLARLLGGDISATSAPGAGSRFVLTLPRAQDGAQPSTPAVRSEEERAG